MSRNRSSLIITALITVAAAMLIGILIPVLSGGDGFGGGGTADLPPDVQATLVARQAIVDAEAAPSLPLDLLTPTVQAVAVAVEPAAPTTTPTVAPTATAAPTATQTETPTEVPTEVPTEAPVEEPTSVPAEAPAAEEPTVEPTAEPVAEPTAEPAAEPTATPAPAAYPDAEVEPILPPADNALATVLISAEAGMNVRQGPSTETDVVTALPNGAQVPAVGRTADSQWIQIYLADLETNGWLFATLVTVEGDVAGLPVVP